jgi:hypothetical protein
MKKVIVYQDPLTQQKPEGEAYIIKKLRDMGFYDGKKLTLCKVRFVSDDWTQTYERIILEAS